MKNGGKRVELTECYGERSREAGAMWCRVIDRSSSLLMHNALTKENIEGDLVAYSN